MSSFADGYAAASEMSVLPFLRDCLAEDRAGAGISNVSGSRVRARCLIQGEKEAALGDMGIVSLSAADTQGTLQPVTKIERLARLYCMRSIKAFASLIEASISLTRRLTCD